MSQKVILTDFLITQNRPNTTSFHTRKRMSNRIKQLKKQISQADILYKRKLSDLNHTQKSISKSNIEAQKTKVNFLKLYEKKKMKLMSKNKLQNKSLSDQQRLKTASKNVKHQRILDELQMTAIKQQIDEANSARTEKYKREKQMIKNDIKVRSNSEYMKAKQMYIKQKKYKEYLQDKKSKVEGYFYMKGKQNYAQKLQKELKVINDYEDVLKNIEDGSLLEDDSRPSTSMSKNFFITSRRVQPHRKDQHI